MKNTTWLIVLVLVILGAYLYRAQLQSLLMGSSSPAPVVQTENLSPAPTSGAEVTSPAGDALVMTKTDAAKGDYLVGPSGMTLYLYDKDTAGVTNCYDTCATQWPPYTATNAPATLPANFSVVSRTDGSQQYAYRGMPLYYWVSDKVPGDTTGDGVGGVWHLVKP